MTDKGTHETQAGPDYFSSSVLSWANGLTDLERAEVGRLALENPDNADAQHAFNAVKADLRKKSRDMAARPAVFTPENQQGAKGLWGLRGALPTWMGGNTINWEEPPRQPKESAADYEVRADEEYQVAHDEAVRNGIPIRRIAKDRNSVTGIARGVLPYWMGGEAAPPTPKELVGIGMGAASGIPGAHGIVRGTAEALANIPETALNIMRGGPAGAVAGLLKENKAGPEVANYLQEAEESVPILGPLAGLIVGSKLPLGGLEKIGGSGALPTIARNAGLSAGSSFISSATERAADIPAGIEFTAGNFEPEVNQAIGAAGMSVPLSLFGLSGRGMSNMVRKGSMAGDFAALGKAGGRSSITKGFKFPDVVERAIAQDPAYPESRVAQMVRDPVIQKILNDHQAPMAELGARNKAFINSPQGREQIRPTEYANAIVDTFKELDATPGADAPIAKIRRLAPKVFEPISFKNRTLASDGDDSAMMGLKQGDRIISAQEAERMGLRIDTTIPNIDPRHVDPTIMSLPGAGAPMDKSRLRVILRARPMDARTLHHTKGYAEEAARVDNRESRGKTAKDMHPILKGLLESRDHFGYNSDAPETLTATITLANGKTKVLKGWSAINQMESQQIEKFKQQLSALGVAAPEQGISSTELQKPITDAIQGFGTGAADRDDLLEKIVRNMPGGRESLYAAPLARRAADMKAKASVVKNFPIAGSGLVNPMRPFLRAVGIHADPVLRGVGKYASKASVAAGSEGADLFALQELADQLEEEQRRKQENER